MRGIERMVEDDRYCIDILTQIAAVTRRSSPSPPAARGHVKHCVARRSRPATRPWRARRRGAARGRPALRAHALGRERQRHEGRQDDPDADHEHDRDDRERTAPSFGGCPQRPTSSHTTCSGSRAEKVDPAARERGPADHDPREAEPDHDADEADQQCDPPVRDVRRSSAPERRRDRDQDPGDTNDGTLISRERIISTSAARRSAPAAAASARPSWTPPPPRVQQRFCICVTTFFTCETTR